MSKPSWMCLAESEQNAEMSRMGSKALALNTGPGNDDNHVETGSSLVLEVILEAVKKPCRSSDMERDTRKPSRCWYYKMEKKLKDQVRQKSDGVRDEVTGMEKYKSLTRGQAPCSDPR